LHTFGVDYGKYIGNQENGVELIRTLDHLRHQAGWIIQRVKSPFFENVYNNYGLLNPGRNSTDESTATILIYGD
jgi:hypothetical protein